MVVSGNTWFELIAGNQFVNWKISCKSLQPGQQPNLSSTLKSPGPGVMSWYWSLHFNFQANYTKGLMYNSKSLKTRKRMCDILFYISSLSLDFKVWAMDRGTEQPGGNILRLNVFIIQHAELFCETVKSTPSFLYEPGWNLWHSLDHYYCDITSFLVFFYLNEVNGSRVLAPGFAIGSQRIQLPSSAFSTLHCFS